MKIPKQIAENANEYSKVKKRTNELYEQLSEFADGQGICEYSYITGFGICKNPKGKKLKDGSYCEEHMVFEDSEYGTLYFPIEESKEFMFVSYNF